MRLSLLAELLILLPQRRKRKGWDVGQLVELLTEHAHDPGLILSINPGQRHTPSIPVRVETGGIGIQGHPRPHGEFRASLGYM